MKIWYQSATTYRYESRFDEYGKTLEEICQGASRPDTKVHVEGIPVIAKDVEKYNFLQYYEKAEFLNNMIRAEKEGYDAFVIGCDLEPGLEEGKALLNIPVVGISEASYHLAMMMGHLFTVVTCSMAFFNIFKRQVEKYGLAGKYLPGPYFYKASEAELSSALVNPGPVIDKYKEVAQKAIADGVSVIILNPAFIAALAYKTGWTKEQDAVILNPITAVVKTAEMMVDLKKLGFEPSRQIGVYAFMDKDKRDEAIKQFEKVFKISV
jgi:Asp/Glu/hydantoin racemase